MATPCAIMQNSMTSSIIFKELGRLKLTITSSIVISANTTTTIAKWLWNNGCIVLKVKHLGLY